MVGHATAREQGFLQNLFRNFNDVSPSLCSLAANWEECSVLSIDSGLLLLQLLMSTGAGGSIMLKRRMFDSPFRPDQVALPWKGLPSTDFKPLLRSSCCRLIAHLFAQSVIQRI